MVAVSSLAKFNQWVFVMVVRPTEAGGLARCEGGEI